MAVKTSWSSGDVLTAADLTDTFAAKLDASAYTPGLALISPTSITYSGGSASSSEGKTTFTGVSSVSLNGVFSSTYSNYRVLLSYSGSSSTYLNMRLRGSGSDLSTSTYSYQMMQGSASSVIAARSTAQTAWVEMMYFDTVQSVGSLDILSPALAKATFISVSAGRSTPVVRTGAGNNSTASSYDGLTLYPTTGNITGELFVYGYEGA